MSSCIARFHRGGQFKQLIMHTHVWLNIHIFLCPSLHTLLHFDPQALSGWLPVASISEARLLSEQMWMSSLELSQQLRILSTLGHI